MWYRNLFLFFFRNTNVFSSGRGSFLALSAAGHDLVHDVGIDDLSDLSEACHDDGSTRFLWKTLLTDGRLNKVGIINLL